MAQSDINNANILKIDVLRISDDGPVRSFKTSDDFIIKKVVSRTPISSENVNLNLRFGESCAENVVKVNLTYPNVNPDDKLTVNIVKTGDLPKLNTRIPIIPVMIRCLNCDINFHTQNQLEHHLCDYSENQVVLDGKKNLRKSVPSHSSQQETSKPFVCKTCKKSFARNVYLLKHEKFHEDIKAFGCNYEGCGKSFAILVDLADHERKVHTRERPFMCHVCGKSFLTKSVFYQHQLIHTNDRRYGCEMCDKNFLRSHDVTIHMRTHTREAPYVCEICGCRSRDKTNMNKHIRNVHSK